jgi:TusA-related sulfurtransferase
MTVELSSYLTNFFNNIILIWFAQKNHIKVREPWLYRLMARQYVTKNDLLKYDNDYLSAILHYYRLSDESIAIIKDKINEIVAYNIDLSTISVWEKIFSQRFILDSNILYHRIAINEIFRLQHPQEREKFEEFQKYLDQNRQHIVDLVMDNVKANEQGNYEVNYALNLPKIITDIGRLYRMHIMFDFARLNEMIHDTSFNDVEATMVDTGFGVLRKTDDVNVSDVFHRGIDTLLNESDKFFITKFNPLYKKKIERKFTMFGEKWQLKLDFKNVHTGATTLFEVSAHLTNLTTNNTIEIVINNPNFKRDVTMNVEPEDLVKYIYVNGKRRLHIDFDKLGYTKGDEIRKLKGKQLIQAFCKYNAAPMLYRRKKPADDSSFVHVLRKVYEQFYSYTRMFTVDYQVLYPILDYHRKEITILNKYTYIKP